MSEEEIAAFQGEVERIRQRLLRREAQAAADRIVPGLYRPARRILMRRIVHGEDLSQVPGGENAQAGDYLAWELGQTGDCWIVPAAKAHKSYELVEKT